MAKSTVDDDEPDYMSDDFLAKCIPEDVRPGLKRSYKSQREHEIQKKKDELLERDQEIKKFRLPKGLEEIQNREEGLQKSIDSTNKGFEMLKKMGYKEGESLGKFNTGRVEPIPIEIKSNRCGLGRENAIKKVLETKSKLRQKHLEQSARKENEQVSTHAFRSLMSRHHKSKLTEGDLYRSQKACCQLDQSKGYTEPLETWFWPEANDDNINTEDEDYSDKQPDNVDELKDGADPIVDISNLKEVIETTTTDQNKEVNNEFSPEEQLEMISEYLRSEYFYCLWCGITFSDFDDMFASCPGPTRADHDD